MSDAITHHFDATRDLKLERTVDIAADVNDARWQGRDGEACR